MKLTINAEKKLYDPLKHAKESILLFKHIN